MTSLMTPRPLAPFWGRTADPFPCNEALGTSQMNVLLPSTSGQETLTSLINLNYHPDVREERAQPCSSPFLNL